GGVCRIVLPDADHLARQDWGKQPHLGQWPLPAGKGGRSERMLGDLPDECIRIIGRSFDADEADPVGTGDSAKAHDFSLVAVTATAAASPRPQASHYMGVMFSIVRSLCDHGRVSIESVSSVRRWSMLVIALTA